MRKYLISVLATLIGVGVISWLNAGSMTLIPNESAFNGSTKDALNTNFVLISDWMSVGTNTATLAAGKVWIGDANGQAQATDFSGDITIITNGTTTIGAHKVTRTMLPAMTDGQVIVGNSVDSNALIKTMSGDVTITTNGVTAVGARKVLSSMMPALTEGQIYVGFTGNQSNALAKSMSGCATIDTNGVITTAGVLTTNIDFGFGTTNYTLYITNGLIRTMVRY